MREIVAGVAQMTSARIDLEYERGYPSWSTGPRRPSCDAGGEGKYRAANGKCPRPMGGEDFSYMLEKRPGAFIFVGNGDSAGLHNAKYNFNDDAIVYGTSYWIKLVENTLAA